MVSDPGSRFDFGTFVSYLVPGLLLEIVFFLVIDTIKIALSKHSFLFQLTLSLADVATIIATATLVSYLLGLILDMIAHPITLIEEMVQKDKAYMEVFERFLSSDIRRSLCVSSLLYVQL